MAEEKPKCRKRSRHWDDEETKILLSKWSEDSIQEKFRSCARKKKIWKEIVLCLKACGYDRDEGVCKTRIHTLTSKYRSYLIKRSINRTARFKKPRCFYEIDKILYDKTTRLQSINGLYEVPDAFALNKENTLEVNFDNVADKLVNTTHIDNKVHQSSSNLIKVSQSSSIPIEITQSNFIQFEVNQSSSKPIEVDQSSPKPIEITQSNFIQFEVNQSSSKPIEVDQSSYIPIEITQSNFIQFEVNQSSTKPIEVNQSSSKPFEVNQLSSKKIKVSQSRSKPIEVNQSSFKRIKINQAGSKTIENNQSSFKPIEVNQSNSKSKDLLTKEKGFCFEKSNKTQSRNEVSLEKINTNIISFMTTRADADRKFLEKLVEYHEEEEPRVIIKARQVGDIYFIEVELTLTDLTFEKLSSVLKQEFMIEDTLSILIIKLPNILIRNDKDVKRFKCGTELEFLVIN